MPDPCAFLSAGENNFILETRSNHAVFTQKGVQQPVETVADSGRGRVRRTPSPLAGAPASHPSQSAHFNLYKI